MPKKLTKEQFIEKVNIAHGGKYNYSLVDYINSDTKVKIICSIHGEFWQTPHDHLAGKGCALCGNKRKNLNRTRSKEQFINESKQIHGDKYDYSKVNYINSLTKVEIVCPTHGPFWQKPNDHINQSQGCPSCGGVKKKCSEEFIKDAVLIHGDKYDYSKVNYVNNRTLVAIICPAHGEFIQKPFKHLQGHGCPLCSSSKGELRIKDFLDKNNIDYVYNKSCLDFLGELRPDFYLPDYNLIIEYDGIQHFEPVDAFGGKEEFLKTKERDTRKTQLCEENSVSVLRIPYTEFNNIEKILINSLKR